MKLISTSRVLAGTVALSLGAAACGGAGTAHTNSSSSASSGSPSTTVAPAPKSSPSSAASVTSTPAATLRAQLDALLREHVDLTGVVVQDAVSDGLTSPQTQAAVTVLGQNTDALGAAVGSLYGPAAQKQFLDIWRAHIGYFVDYTKGVATNDPAMVAKANQDLAGYETDFGKFLASATGGKLPATAAAADLKGHVQTLEAAISAIVAKSPTAGVKLQMAADHMDGTAAVLAGAFAQAKHVPGNPNGAGATLRAELTGMLVQHVAATATVVQSAASTGLTSAQTQGAITALDSNTQHLGAAIGSIYGSAAQQQFLKLWTAHIGFFVNYTKGLATHDQAMVAQANSDLNGYVDNFAGFVASATKGKLSKTAAAADLQGHVQTLEAAISAIVANSPTAPAKIQMAESHMVGTATVLSSAIAAAAPSKFSS